MIIMEVQMEIFSKIDYEKFINQLRAWIIKNYPEKVWRIDPLELDIRIKKTVNTSLSFKIYTERNVVWFTDFTFQLEEEFYCNKDYDWTREILNHPLLSEDEKIEELRKVIYAE